MSARFRDLMNNLPAEKQAEVKEMEVLNISQPSLRWLKAQGVEVKDGSNHIKLYLNGKQSVLPRHPSKEIARGTEIAVKKQLGLK